MSTLQELVSDWCFGRSSWSIVQEVEAMEDSDNKKECLEWLYKMERVTPADIKSSLESLFK